MKDVLYSKVPIVGDIAWHERFFQLRGAPLAALDGEETGAVIVFNEVTRIYRLEGIRRDFVANVSHELRTPITSIKGFAETLLENESTNPDERQKFLKIIIRQANRLNVIIEDLLELSRIEKQSKRNEIHLSPCELDGVLNQAKQSCTLQARKKNIVIELKPGEGIAVNMNADLLERAVTNLVDNAIKYSDEGTRIGLM